MPGTARQQYLTTEVMTASPQKLHLMLIEGAMRFVYKARQHGAAGEDEPAREAVSRARRIMADILAGFKKDLDPGLVNQVTLLYGFVYRTLLEAAFSFDDAKLAGVLRILEIERDTWRQVCADLAGQFRPEPQHPSPPRPIPQGVLDALPLEGQRGQFSFEA